MENENTKEKEKSTVLRCAAFGDLRPADIREACENCEYNAQFADDGGLPAMLLTGSRENLAAALRAPGVANCCKSFRSGANRMALTTGSCGRFWISTGPSATHPATPRSHGWTARSQRCSRSCRR